ARRAWRTKASEEGGLLGLGCRSGFRPGARGLLAITQEAPRPRRRAGRAGQLAEAFLDRLRRVRAAAVQLLVARHEVGPVRSQPVHEDVAHLAAEVKRDAADAHRARLGRDPDDLLDLLGRVVDPGHQWGDEDAGGD